MKLTPSLTLRPPPLTVLTRKLRSRVAFGPAVPNVSDPSGLNCTDLLVKDLGANTRTGGNFPTMPSIEAWEREFKKPVVTTNQASFWAVLRAFKSTDRVPGFGRLLAELPADTAS